jgi:hypothetical protein
MVTPTSALPHRLPRPRLTYELLREEPAISRLDWSFAPIPRSSDGIARHNLFGPPRTFRYASACPGIDRLVSGIRTVTIGRLGPAASSPARLSVSLRLRYGSTLSSPLPVTPWPVIQDGWSNPGPLPSFRPSRGFASRRISPCGPLPSKTAWFQALFTSLPGCFSSFPRGTSALSVLDSI